MRFIQPQLFYLVLPVLLAVIVLAVYASHCRKQKVLALLGSGDTDPAAVKLSPARRRFRIFLLLLAMFFLIAAAARPFWSSQLVPFEPRGRDLMVIFDVSKSMLATDIAPSRLEHAKVLLRQLVESAPNDRFGLVAFAGKAYLACPLTSDSLAFTQYIDELNTDTVPLGGTNLEAALRVAEQAFKAAAGGNRGILLFTDGDELAGNSAALVDELRKRQIPLFIVGLGDPEIGAPVPEADGTLKRDASGQLITSKLAETSLKKLAGETGGVYVRSTVTDTGLAVIENRIKRLDTAELQGAQRTLPVEKFPLALIAAAVCLILYFLLSERPLEYRFSRPKSTALLLTAMLFLLTGAAAPEKTETVPPQQPKEIPVEPETPSDPAELYNLARERQIAGDEKAANLYETVIRDAADRPDLQTRSLYNLGTGEHRNARTIAQQAVAKVKAQQLDPALEELKKAEGRLKSAEELYVRSLEIPQLQNAVPEASSNLQQLADDRKKIEELKKKIEELKKLQQQARQQTQQAQQQNQQDQQKQDQQQGQQGQNQKDQPKQDQQKQDQQQGQQGQDQKDQSKQDQQKQDQQQGQQGQDQKDQPKQDQQKQDQQQGQQDQDQQNQQQKSGENALDQARKSAEELKNKADELQQQNLSKQAEQARQELDKAEESREQQKFDEAQKHLEEAMKALGGSQGQDQKDQQGKDQKDQQGKDQKDQQGKDQKDQQQGKDQKDQQSPEGRQDQKEQQGEEAKPEDGKMDEKTAEQLLQMMADEEKGLRDAIKQHQRSRQPRVEKDW